jgi:hypothetical protein
MGLTGFSRIDRIEKIPETNEQKQLFQKTKDFK